MASITETTQNSKISTKNGLPPNETSRRNWRAGKYLGATVFLALGVKLVAPNLVQAFERNRFGPPQINRVEYTVGPTQRDAVVSEIASDMHKVAPHQNQSEADTAIQTYLPEVDQKHYIVHPYEHFVFTVDESSGKILPKPNTGHSAENK